MRFFVLGNELEIIEIAFVESRIGEILLCEFLEPLFVVNIFEMLELRESASHAEQSHIWMVTYSEGKLKDYQVQVCECP